MLQCFNQPIGKWNVENKTSMSKMFEGASNFNQYINSESIETFNGKVTGVLSVDGLLGKKYE